MLGALCHYITACDPERFQPMKSNFGILPTLDLPPRQKALRYQAYAERALAALERCMQAAGWSPIPTLVQSMPEQPA